MGAGAGAFAGTGAGAGVEFEYMCTGLKGTTRKGFGPPMPTGAGDGEARCGGHVGYCGCCIGVGENGTLGGCDCCCIYGWGTIDCDAFGHMGRGQGNCGPREPRKLVPPNIGDIGVELGDTGLFGELYALKYCGRGPDMIGGGDGPHGDGA